MVSTSATLSAANDLRARPSCADTSLAHKMLYAFALLAMAAPLAKNLQPTAEGAAVAKTRHLSMDGGNPIVAQVPCAHVLLAITSIKNGDAESLAKCFYCDDAVLGGRMSAHAASYHLGDTSFGIEQIYMDDEPNLSYNVTCEFSKADCESYSDSRCDVVSSEVNEDRRALSSDEAFDAAFDGEPPYQRPASKSRRALAWPEAKCAA